MCVLLLGKCFYFISKIKAEVTATNDVKDIMPGDRKYITWNILDYYMYILWIITRNLEIASEKIVNLKSITKSLSSAKL